MRMGCVQLAESNTQKTQQSSNLSQKMSYQESRKRGARKTFRENRKLQRIGNIWQMSGWFRRTWCSWWDCHSDSLRQMSSRNMSILASSGKSIKL
uniref:CCR4-NOT transcription complex n=1 Tax=Haliotis diversicolor supertexta TaxID=283615 RepID=E4W3F4_HALDV|nr:CCR4-NOT transcription complex [Haliotis diversicolor supertexta]